MSYIILLERRGIGFFDNKGIKFNNIFFNFEYYHAGHLDKCQNQNINIILQFLDRENGAKRLGSGN